MSKRTFKAGCTVIQAQEPLHVFSMDSSGARRKCRVEVKSLGIEVLIWFASARTVVL